MASLLKRKVTPEMTAARPRMIYELTKRLLNKGHEVTLLATADSCIPGATIVPIIAKGFVDLPLTENPFYTETGYLVQLAQKIEEMHTKFDIVHNHTYPEFINLLVANKINTPIITTVHAQGTEEFDRTLKGFDYTYLISISKAHRSLFGTANFYRTIYNGIDTSLYKFESNKDDYLLWLGRLSKAKNPDGSFMDPKGIKWAIQLARETNQTLILSGNVEDMDFYNQEVKPFLNERIKWHGPISPEQVLSKDEVVGLMQKAKAFLMTINWFEPFGLVMAEAMSCGTPVIGFNRGSVSELVKDGLTGFVVNPTEGIEGLKKVLNKINQIKSEDCRNHVVNNFSVETMVDNYEKAYRDIISEKKNNE